MLQRRMTHSSKWSVIVAKTWLPAGSTGRISLPENICVRIDRPTKKAYGTGPARPMRKKYVRKDATRVSVLVTVAVLNLSPFRWITISQILSGGDGAERVPALAEYFTRKYAREMGKQVAMIPSDTMQALVGWHWPGNVRELENFIERSVILSGGSTLRAPLAELRADAVGTAGRTLEEMEREYVVRILQETDGVISAAAARLGVPRTTLNAMMQRLGISRKDF